MWMNVAIVVVAVMFGVGTAGVIILTWFKVIE